jgi:pimeloyl-ACP methyl ester carboxylesterase
MNPHDVKAVIFLESSTIEDVEDSRKSTKTPTHVGDSVGKARQLAEVDCVPKSVEQLKALNSFPQVPITVIAGFHTMGKLFLPKGRFQKRFENQKKLLELSAESQLIVAAKSGHFPQMNEPILVVEAILDLIKK